MDETLDKKVKIIIALHEFEKLCWLYDDEPFETEAELRVEINDVFRRMLDLQTKILGGY